MASSRTAEITQGSVAEYKVVFADSVHVLMLTVAQQSVPIAVATDRAITSPCRDSRESFGFQEELWSGEEEPRFAPDAIVLVSGPAGLLRRILCDGLSWFLVRC